MTPTFACAIPGPETCCASTCANSAAATGSQDEDRPAKTPRSTRQLLARCEKVGQHIGAFCQGLHRNHGEVAVRRIPGVSSMAKKYGVASTQDACAVALETGANEYHFVRRYLERSPQLPLHCARSIRSSAHSRCTVISLKTTG
jgi:hypothetical protein